MPLKEIDLKALSLSSPYLAGKVELDIKTIESLKVTPR
jgi:hypothetical protein